MQPRHLEAFRLVVELGSFTKAAEALCISQPAVSKMIFLLERECRFKLFRKRNNQSVPTAEALMLFSEVQRIARGTRSIEARAAAIRDQQYGHLNICVFPAIATQIFPQLVSEFLQSHPGVRFSVSVRDAATFLDLSMSHDFDLGISVAEVNRMGTILEPFVELEIVCALPTGHPLLVHRYLTPELIGCSPFISVRSCQSFDAPINAAFDNAGVSRNVVVEAALSESACSFVANGVGVALIDPLPLFQNPGENVQIRAFRPNIKCNTYLLFPSHKEQSIVLGSFTQHISRRLRDIQNNILKYYLI